MQTGGCLRTPVSFNSSLDLALQNSVTAATGIPTTRVEVTVDGPDQDPPPAGAELAFSVQRAGTFFTAIGITQIGPLFFEVTIPAGAGALERARYTAAGPIWTNAAGGRLLAFDVPLPFP